MATQVIMPKLSPTMEEGQLSRWLKKEGDKVSMGEPLAEIDTDKATMEMQALGSGVLRKILIQEGQSAPLGQVIAVIGEPNEDISGLISQAAQPPAAESKEEPEAEQKPAETAPAEAAPARAPKAEQKPAETAPAEAAPARAPEPEQKPAQPAPAEAAPARAPEPEPSGGNGRLAPQPTATSSGRLLVSPLAARMAAEAGVDLRSITGSGPGGRIIKRDVENLMTDQGAASQPAGAPTKPRLSLVDQAPKPAVVPGQPSTYRDEPITEIRRTIAKRLVTSLGPVPHFFLTVEIEMDRAAEMRAGINNLEPDLKISLNDIIIKVAAAALMQHPQVNASFQDKVVRYYDHADIGVAVAIEDGLITPIVRGADQKSLSQIASEVRELAERARNRKLRPEEYMGATFSISNLGMFGIDEFTAVINPPEAAILAVGAMAAKPVVRNSEVVVRQMMHATMSCDHRVVDGATGAKFLQTFKKFMENPLFLLV
jgi:pyruvate dehydrogenase E2 component (dihydrolipoamide acetyltransferase)